jgi:polyisoprenoid-binding protein YceI
LSLSGSYLRAQFGALLLLHLGISTAFAQSKTFTVNPDQSEVAFSLGDVLHQVHGTFHIQNGNVSFDDRSPHLSGSIVVAAGSGKSGNNTRDRRMTVDILNAPQFAEASFSPKQMIGSVAAAGDSAVQVVGVLMLHGTAHDLTVPMQIHIDGKTCTAKTRFVIPYVKWGLKDPSTFLLRVDKEVEMEITLVGQLSATTLQ